MTAAARRDWTTASRYLLSTAGHALAAAWIAVTAFHVAPAETGTLLFALGVALLLDLDHLFYVLRHWDRYRARKGGNPRDLHPTRSPLHELLGILLAGVMTALLTPFDRRLAGILFVAFTLHVVQDWFLGRPSPLAPVDDIKVEFFTLTQREKALIDGLLVLTFGFLWLLYLTGRV